MATVAKAALVTAMMGMVTETLGGEGGGVGGTYGREKEVVVILQVVVAEMRTPVLVSR